MAGKTHKDMTSQEMTEFADDLYKKGYRADDSEEIRADFPEITNDDIDSVCELLRLIDCYKAEDGAKIDIDGKKVRFAEKDIPRTFGMYLEGEERDYYLGDYEQWSMKKEDLVEKLREILADFGE